MPHQEQIGGAREQESSGRSVPINGPLHGAQQFRFALHLVKRHRTRAAHEDFRVAPRRIEHIEIIERGVAPLSSDELFDQSALASLPGPRDDDGWHDPQALGEGNSDQPGKRLHAMDDSHSRHE